MDHKKIASLKEKFLSLEKNVSLDALIETIMTKARNKKVNLNPKILN